MSIIPPTAPISQALSRQSSCEAAFRPYHAHRGRGGADEEYITRVSATVADRLSLSRIIENEDYYGFLFD